MSTNTPLLLTGAAGFIGARFASSCNAQKIPLLCADALEHFSSRREHAPIHFGEILSRTGLIPWLKENRPAIRAIIHLGACTDTTEMDIRKLTELNLEFSKQLWTYATENRVPFIYASSAATYGAGEIGYDDDPAQLSSLKPLNPYGDSKHQFDLWVMKEVSAGRCPPIWSGHKFFNVYGFGERHKGKMASVVLHGFDQIRTTGRMRLFKSYREEIADGLQKRDFVYVNDVINVLKFAIDEPFQNGIYNLGTGKARSFLDLARATFRAMALPEKIDFIEMPPSLVERYQYFTEARMDRLRGQGFRRDFTSLEDGVSDYVSQLMGHYR